MRFVTFLLMALLTFTYASIGGVIFHYLESGYEQDLTKEFNNTLQLFIQQRSCFNYSDIFILEEIMKQLQHGGLYINGQGNVTSFSSWDIRSAIFVAAELFVGIGASSMPITDGGRAFVDLYVLVGIFFEFTVIYLMGKVLNLLIDIIWKKLFGETFTQRHRTLDKLLRALFLAFVGAIFFTFIPGIIFSSLEKWTYAESLYFILTSLYGIGFGDFQTGMNHNLGFSDDFLKWYQLAVGIWMILQIMWFGSLLFQFYDAVHVLIGNKTDDKVNEWNNQWREKIPRRKKKKVPTATLR